MIKRFFITICLLTIILTLSCSEDNCYENITSYTRACFFEDDKPSAPDNLTVIAIGIDSAILDKTSGHKDVDLPLNPSSTTCGFIFEFDTISDEVIFTYTSSPVLFSKACGYSFEYEITSVSHSHNVISNIEINDKKVTSSNEKNISIHY